MNRAERRRFERIGIHAKEIDTGKNEVTMDIDEFKRLSKLAEIGMATEKAFNYTPKNYYQYNVFSLGEFQEEADFSFYSKEDLLNWAESEESNES